MHPSSGENLPPPQFEAPSPLPNSSETGLDQARESVHEAETASESAAGRQQQPAMTTPADPTVASAPAAPVVAAPTDKTQAVATTTDLVAADVNLIEKPWVEKTKKVVQATKDDPFKQKREVSRLQVDYLKKRFNKAIPLEDAT